MNINIKRLIKYLIAFLLASILIYYLNMLDVFAFEQPFKKIDKVNLLASSSSVPNGYSLKSFSGYSLGTVSYRCEGYSSSYNYNYDNFFNLPCSGSITQIIFPDFKADLYPDFYYIFQYEVEANDAYGSLFHVQYIPEEGASYRYNTSSVEISTLSSNHFLVRVRFNVDVYRPSFNPVQNFNITSNGSSLISNVSLYKSDKTISEIDKQEILDQQNQNKQDIMDNQDKLNEELKENQDKNAEKVEGAIKDGFESCVDSYNLFNINGDLTYYGGISLSNTPIVQDDGTLKLPPYNPNLFTTGQLIRVKQNTYYTLSGILLSANGTHQSNVRIYIFKESGRTAIANYSISKNVSKPYNFKYTFNTGENSGIWISFNPNNSSSNDERETNTVLDKILLNEGTTEKTYVSFDDEVCTNRMDETNAQLGNLNDSLNNSDSSGASDSASNFFTGFKSNEHGLTSIITAPLNLIKSITSQKCSPLGLEVPFLKTNNKINLPCMGEIYQKNFGVFLDIYQTITFGIVAYWVCVQCYAMVKGFQNPDDDKIEVMDL